jgi:hypothetical protein
MFTGSNPTTQESTMRIAPGTVLFTNAPGHEPIKPVPIELASAGVIGPASGFASRDHAVVAAMLLTRGDAGAAAIVREGARFVAHALRSSWGDEPALLSGPVHHFGGRPTVHPAVVAFVDGTWVQHVG